jgi:FKBP-type peptidyl-prolyl cis-trans isomerase FklB
MIRSPSSFMARRFPLPQQTVTNSALPSQGKAPPHSQMWFNTPMRKTLITSIIAVASTVALLGPARAQQTPPATPQPAPAAKTQRAPAAKTGAASTLVLKTQKEKASYAVGVNIGRGMRRDALDVDPAIVARGLRDGLAGNKPVLSDQEMQTAFSALQDETTKKQQAMKMQAADTNKTQGDAFLAANKTKPGVVTLASGLQYKILTEGTGPKPSAGDSVVCNYRGTLIDGTEFDSSYKRGQPATFPVGRVIKGWTEALQLMPVGSKWQLFVPADLAYGDRGAGQDIGPNATLIFEVELISIQGKTQ